MAEVGRTDWLKEALNRQATPKHLREETVEAFCERHDIERSTYYYELSKDENKKKILEISLNLAKDEAPEILNVLIQKAKEGDMRAIDTYLDSVIQLAKNLDIKSDGRPIFIPSEIADKNAINTSSEPNS